jgi:hypothetical protein
MSASVIQLPTPSKRHATCAWCTVGFPSIVELLSHVEVSHVAAPGASGRAPMVHAGAALASAA